MRKRALIAVLATVVVAVGAGVAASELGAQSSDGAIENLTPTTVKLLHTGGSTPNSQYADLGRLTLPVGSWSVTAETTIRSQGPPTGVDCFLVAPNGQIDHQQIEITSTKNDNIADMAFGTVTNAPNGGSADLFCKVSNPSADRRVFADHTTLIGVSVSGVTSTRNPAPPLGTY